jgi:hypothetical protein
VHDHAEHCQKRFCSSEHVGLAQIARLLDRHLQKQYLDVVHVECVV